LTQIPNRQAKFVPEDALATAGLLLTEDIANPSALTLETKKKQRSNQLEKPEPEDKSKQEAKLKKVEMFLKRGMFDFEESELSSSDEGSESSGEAMTSLHDSSSRGKKKNE